MSNVKNATEQLVAAVKDSTVYQEYRKQLALVKQCEGLKEKIDEFRERNYTLQNSPDVAFDKLDALEREYEEFRREPLVSDFLAAELAFCRMMQEINNYITESVQFE